MRMPVTSREYKVMLHAAGFADRGQGAKAFLKDLAALAAARKIAAQGKWDDSKERRIRFFDTPSLTLLQHDLILRSRGKPAADKVSWTLKMRGADRYIVAAADLRAAGVEEAAGDAAVEPPKFEEDIAAPFRCQFAKSISIKRSSSQPEPATLGKAAEVFPLLKSLQRDGLPCSPATPLMAVRNQTYFETSLTGLRLELAGASAEAALILWSRDEASATIAAEFSFRYGNDQEDYSEATAAAAKEFYQDVQRLDWSDPAGRTKTELAYGIRRGG